MKLHEEVLKLAYVTFLKARVAREEKKAKLKSKREEVERKARRGEIDPMHEHAIQNISQVRASLLFMLMLKHINEAELPEKTRGDGPHV